MGSLVKKAIITGTLFKVAEKSSVIY